MKRTWAPVGVIALLSVGCGSSAGSGGGGPDAASETSQQDGNTSRPDGATGPDGTTGPDGSAEDAPAEAASVSDGGDDGADAPGTWMDGSPDGSGDSGGSTAAYLTCNGVQVPNDALNCGTCGHDCTTLHSASTPTCVAGDCTFPNLVCQAGWAHCSNNPSDGCEADLTKAAHCGSCSMSCGMDPLCFTSDAGSSCVTVTQVAAGDEFTVALLSNGSVLSWGNNGGGYEFGVNGGELGTGSSATSVSTPAPVANVTSAKAIAAGDSNACALLTDGTVACWGDNSWGQLGVDPNTTSQSYVPLAVAGITNATAIDVGGVHACALIADGTVKCWGSNIYGELGNATSTTCNGSDACSFTPTAVSGLGHVTAIAIGNEYAYSADHTCALLSDQTVSCWGFAFDGELGIGLDGGLTSVATPTAVPGISGATALNAHYEGGCVLFADGTVKCWGEGGSGTLGAGTNYEHREAPVPVVGLTDAASLSQGSTTAVVCAIRSGGTAVCWGGNGNGEVGAGGTSTADDFTPQPLVSLTNVTQIGLGTLSSCAVASGGNLWCWGADADGELANSGADPYTNTSPLPVQW